MSLRMLMGVLAPTQVAPHPNFGEDQPSAPAALASVVLSSNEHVLSSAEVTDAANERAWAIVAAAADSWTVETLQIGVSQLSRLLSTSADGCEAATLVALLRYALTDVDEYRDADEACGRALALVSAESDPLGRAVIFMQAAAAKAELGDFSAARERNADAREALSSCTEPQDDISLSRGARYDATGLYRLVADGLDRVAQRNDAAWTEDWPGRVGLIRLPLDRYEHERLVAVSGVLGVLLDESLSREAEQMALDRSGIRRYARDPVDSPLAAYLFAASASGDWGASANASHLLGSARLSWHSRSEWSSREALRLSRRSRDDQLAARVVRLVRTTGPLAPLEAEMQLVASGALPSPQEQARLAMLRVGARMLDPSAADRVLAELLDHPKERLSSPRPGAWFDRLHEHWRTAAAVIPASSNQDLAARKVLSLLDGQAVSDIGEQDLVGVVGAIDWTRVAGETRQYAMTRLASNSATMGPRLTCHIATELSPYLPEEAIAVLRRLSGDGMTSLLAASIVDTGRHTQIPDDLAEAVADHIVVWLSGKSSEAAGGSYSFGGVDVAHLAAVFSVRVPTQATWDALVDFLDAPAVPDRDKAAAWDYLASSPENLPAVVKNHLRSLATAGPDLIDPWLGSDDRRLVRLRARIAGGGCTQDEVATALAKACSDPDAVVRWDAGRTIPVAARILEPDRAHSLALLLLHDRSPSVRRMAVHAIERLNPATDAPGIASALRDCLLHDPGLDVPLEILETARRSGRVKEMLGDSVRIAAETGNARLLRDAAAAIASAPA